MLTTEQTKGQTVFQHGQSVQLHTFRLIDALRDDDLQPSGWRLPSWVIDFKSPILANLHAEETIAAYTLYHDCGKPLCRVVDTDGKIHFPNHAEVSRQTYLSATGDTVVANLIGWDMSLHCESAEAIQFRCESVWTVRDAVTLLLVALAEIHSNAQMFGGVDSTSFKIKWKTLEKRGKQVCKHFFGKEPK